MSAPQPDRPATMHDAIHELGLERKHLCREPWESYYILRRGILPCCYGAKPIAPMSEWATAWNSPALREIRSYLAKGELSPYCRRSVNCPIVQRYHQQHPPGGAALGSLLQLPAFGRHSKARSLLRLAARVARRLGVIRP